MGLQATANVVRNSHRTVQVSVPVVARGPDGQVRYQGIAKARFQIAAGDSLPEFSIDVRIVTEELRPEVADG